jgi:ParB family transcriptional regulator, chromosome partitioning protein
MDTPWLDLDLHRLELRFADARLVEPRAVEQLARSIERGGQIVPCIVVAAHAAEVREGGERLVLIDGYRRVAALRRLGRDTARVECWRCGLAEGLLGVLARAQMSPFAVVEEALLVRELMAGLGLSQHEVARRCGRDVSWVSRRLQLISALPDAALEAMRAGWLSSWAASRVAPLARANSEHADRLLQALAAAPLSTRDLRSWFAHYQEASRISREVWSTICICLSRLVRKVTQHLSELLRDGPEAECETDLRRVNVNIARVRKRLPRICPLPEAVVDAVARVQDSFEALCNDIKRHAEHYPDRDPQQRARAQSALKLSRNTVRRILRDAEAAPVPSCEPLMLARLEDAFARAGGNSDIRCRRTASSKMETCRTVSTSRERRHHENATIAILNVGRMNDGVEQETYRGLKFPRFPESDFKIIGALRSMMIG